MTRLLPTHFDGQHILLDVPIEINPTDRLWVQISDEDGALDLEREELFRSSLLNFGRFYEDEPDLYSDAMIIEHNPHYRESGKNRLD